MATPTVRDIEAYRGNDLSLIWAFTDANTSNAIDVSATYSAIEFIIYRNGLEGTPDFEATLGSGITVSDTNKITIDITDTENEDLFGGVRWFKLTVTDDGVDKTFQAGRYYVYDKNEGAQTETGFALSIDNSTQVTNISVSTLSSLPTPTGGALQFLRVNSDADGYELTDDVTQNTDTDVSGNSWVLDEDNFASDSATKVPTQQSAKKYIDDKASLLQEDIDRNETLIWTL